MRRVVGLVAAVLLSGAAQAQKAPEVQLTGQAAVVSIGITSGGRIFVAVAPRDIGGKLAFCGLSSTEGTTGTTSSLRHDVLRSLYFVLDRKSYDARPEVFPHYADAAAARASGKARCTVTRHDWTPGFAKAAFQPRMRQTTIYR